MEPHIEETFSKAKPVGSLKRAIHAVSAPYPQTSERCPDCGEAVHRSGGCPFCPFCGWSKCP